jgi:pimeloyl-ACP methyl ester carboxylesterase
MDETLHPVDIPNDLDSLEQHIAQSETAIRGLRSSLAKGIVWADPTQKSRTPMALVYIHGFSGSRNEVMPLCDSLAAGLGANLFYTRLAGHGMDADAVGVATLNDWLNDTNEAYEVGRRLGEQVVLIGTSMGGALVTWLTTKKINTPPLALVLISPAYAAKDAKRQKDLIQMVYMPWGEQIIRLMTGGYLGGAPKDDELEWRTPRMRTDAYVTIGAVFELVDAINLAVIESPLSSGCYRLSSELGTIYKSFSCPFPLPPIRTSAFQPDSFGQFLRRDNLP